MKSQDVYEFFSRLHKENPDPKSELDYTNAYTLLVAVALSAQSTDVGVNKATCNLFVIADTPQKMIALGIDGLIDHIKTIGLYNNKAKNIMAAAEMLIKDHDGEVPNTREELIKLPGVGRKTANVLLNVFFKQPTMAVDTHVFRVSNRTRLAPGKNPDAVEKALLQVVPEEFGLHAHHWLILHGRYTCKARKPNCSNCLVSDLCKFEEKTSD